MNNCDYTERKKEADKPPPFDNSSYTCNILQSSWVRRIVRTSDEIHKLVSNNRCYLLLPINPIFWLILYLIKEERINL